MGCGPGPIRERITLADYAARFPAMFTVVGSTYTFTAGEQTVEENYEVEFGESDRMVIPEGSTVNLLGNLEIPDTDGAITRIRVEGALIQDCFSTIKIGNVLNGAIGIAVADGGTMTQNADGVVEVGKVSGLTGADLTGTDE